jgi:hypothetical protein
MDWIGYTCLSLSLVWLALLSRRLGRVTSAPSHYIGLMVAAGMLMVSAVVRLMNGLLGVDVDTQSWWLVVYSGVPALAITLALSFAWRYWSWLLAERD